jgi:hypothetical protein
VNHFPEYKPLLGEPLRGYRFIPGDCIVNSNHAEEYRQGKCTLDQFDRLKMVVLQVGLDPRTNMESYRLLYNSPLKEGEHLPWGESAPWFLKAEFKRRDPRYTLFLIKG